MSYPFDVFQPNSQTLSPPLSSYSPFSSMAEQNASQPRQQNASYPSPHSYPSPSMQSAYSYPPPQGQSASEAYRSSPTGSNMSLPSLNLPPIRAIDGQPQQQVPQQPAPPTGSPLPPPVAPMSAYYPPPGSLPPPAQQMNITSSPQQFGAFGATRYQLPPQGVDQRIMSGGRHKKEIKRRTKTGCLTCRKRRIKCDEAHPTCRNCQKSKRECLGYDPIFKQQPGPAQIQPAPSASPAPSSSSTSAPPASGAYPVPQGYVPANAGYAPPLGSTPGTVPDGGPPYGFGPAIDPALADTETGAMSVPHGPYDGAQHLRPGALGGNAHYAAASTDGLKAKRIKLESVTDLFSINNVPPKDVTPSGNPIPDEVRTDMEMIFTKDYAPSMDRFLETTWYSEHGLSMLYKDREASELFAQLVRDFKVDQGYDGFARVVSTETKVIWTLFGLCRKEPEHSVKVENGMNGTKPDADHQLVELRKRLDVFEHLLTYQPLTINPLMDLNYPNIAPSSLKTYEVEFWKCIGQFVSARSDTEDGMRQIDSALATCRQILGQLENRDVIYSMAVARYHGSKFPEFPDGIREAYNHDQEDPRTKLVVAKRFLEDESNKGTSQVVQRLAGMSIRSWSGLR